MARKLENITFRLSLEDKQLLKRVAKAKDIPTSKLILAGALKEANRLDKFIKKDK